MNNVIRQHHDKWQSHLLIDAMYFHIARQAHARARNCFKEIEEARQLWTSLNQEFERILSNHNNDAHSAYDELEPIAIQIEGAHENIEKSYAPLLKEVAAVHILCAASLEAHINSTARDTFQGKILEHFEALSLEAKWLILPKLLGFSGFESGHEPFQGFFQLLKYRNKLVHYKSMREDWVYGDVPKFITKLGLTLEDSERSIRSVENMIRELARQRAIEAPYWLRSDLNDMSYFELKSM